MQSLLPELPRDHNQRIFFTYDDGELELALRTKQYPEIGSLALLAEDRYREVLGSTLAWMDLLILDGFRIKEFSDNQHHELLFIYFPLLLISTEPLFLPAQNQKPLITNILYAEGGPEFLTALTENA